MRKVFILNYNTEFGSREDIKHAVDQCPHVITWRYDLPNSMYLVSEESAQSIATWLHQNFSTTGRFVVAELTDDYWGWGQGETWYLLANKRTKPKES